ncbi:hypothetical protein JXO59_13865 [candidate division KSB1 bacterium]|nr:hypothetical protein [candidate division KSB1 bacterium]
MIFFQCSERDRSNPLDPRNPETHGRPTGLAAFSMEKRVQLRWDPINFKDLEAIHIYRRAGEDSTYDHIADTLGTTYTDQSVEYGLRYEYYITAQAGGYETGPSNVAHSTPGPTYTWVSDYQAGSVICLTHDLEAEVTRYGLLYYPQTLGVSPAERAVWVSVRYEEQVFKINQSGQMIAAVPNMDNVTDLAVNTNTRDVWIAQDDPGRLTRVDSYGAIRASTVTEGTPVALVVPNASTLCWMVDGEDRLLKAYNTAGQRFFVAETPLQNPMDIVYASHSRTLWVADSSSIVQFDLSGARTGLVVGSFYYVSMLAYDNTHRCLWAVDLEQWGVPAKLIKLDENGTRLFTLEVFSYPVALAANEYDGSCLVGDSGYDHYGLFRVASDGTAVDQIGQFYLPISIAIEYH